MIIGFCETCTYYPEAMREKRERQQAEIRSEATVSDSASTEKDCSERQEQRPKAVETFRTPPFCHNCAQAIAYHWQELFNDKEIVSTYAPYVGGHAPDGYCGALFAAINAVPAQSGSIKRDFQEACGSIYCREIKQSRHTPCQFCVATADSLVEKYIGHIAKKA